MVSCVSERWSSLGPAWSTRCSAPAVEVMEKADRCFKALRRYLYVSIALRYCRLLRGCRVPSQHARLSKQRSVSGIIPGRSLRLQEST